MRIHQTVLVLAGIFAYPAAASLQPREVFKLAEPAVVVVLTADAKGEKNNMGSGVLIAPLEVITSCKVVEGAADIVVTQGNALRKGRLRFQDRERDLCQLHIEDAMPSAKPAQLAESPLPLETGQDVFTISSPQGMERTMSRGMISGLKETQGGSGRLIQLDAIMGSGSRGGGVFDDKANLVGIVTPQFKQTEGTSYALPVEWVADLAKRGADLTLAVAETAPAAKGKSADSAPADERWYPAKGDRWRYRQLDGRRPVGTVNVEVIELGSGRVRERITKDGSAGFSVEREVVPEFSASAFVPSLPVPGGYTLLELSAYFPPGTDLASSKVPRQASGDLTLLSHGKRSLVWNIRVMGQEKVRVPAGEFDAWRIDAVSETVTRHGLIKFTYRIWYSAAMQRAVKTFLDMNSPVGVEKSNETLELAVVEKAK
jgi:S1-C subfamily serine protease